MFRFGRAVSPQRALLGSLRTSKTNIHLAPLSRLFLGSLVNHKQLFRLYEAGPALPRRRPSKVAPRPRQPRLEEALRPNQGRWPSLATPRLSAPEHSEHGFPLPMSRSSTETSPTCASRTPAGLSKPGVSIATTFDRTSTGSVRQPSTPQCPKGRSPLWRWKKPRRASLRPHSPTTNGCSS